MSFNRGVQSYKPIVPARLFILRIACPTLLQITLFEILVKCCSPFIFIYVIYIYTKSVSAMPLLKRINCIRFDNAPCKTSTFNFLNLCIVCGKSFVGLSGLVAEFNECKGNWIELEWLVVCFGLYKGCVTGKC